VPEDDFARMPEMLVQAHHGRAGTQFLVLCALDQPECGPEPQSRDMNDTTPMMRFVERISKVSAPTGTIHGQG
jgi:hypothetical protein